MSEADTNYFDQYDIKWTGLAARTRGPVGRERYVDEVYEPLREEVWEPDLYHKHPVIEVRFSNTTSWGTWLVGIWQHNKGFKIRQVLWTCIGGLKRNVCLAGSGSLLRAQEGGFSLWKPWEVGFVFSFFTIVAVCLSSQLSTYFSHHTCRRIFGFFVRMDADCISPLTIATITA